MKNLFLISSAAFILGACNASNEPATSTQAATAAATSSAAVKPASQNKVMATPVKAVRVYADWCSKCKILDAQLKELRAANDYPNVEFIYLDFTEKDADIFYAQARELGIEAQVKAAIGDRVRTGMMFIFDSKTDALLQTITHTMTTEDLSNTLLNPA